MNRMLSNYDRSYGRGGGWAVTDAEPLTNLYDVGDRLEVKAEVPGLAKEDINIMVLGNYLEISGTRKSDSPEGYKVHREERETEISFTRSFTLPSEAINTEKVGASLKNGILTITLPKTEAAQPKQVAIG
jgi:HSP20 family protein